MFAFYDFETTGISSAFDQPIQFAAILTDEDFNEVETIDIRCRLSAHILPAPMALAVTGVSPDLLTDPNLPTWFEFASQLSEVIHRWAPATWVGYNTMSFDENVMRQSFYQNLHPNIYLTQLLGNTRLDVMHLVYSAWVLANGIFEWPEDDKGRKSFKLDRLSPANGFTEHNAHDALGDVRATIFILKRIKSEAPELFTYALKNRNKADVLARLKRGDPMQIVERFGASPPRCYIGVYAGQNATNPNAVGFLDLSSTNIAELLDADDGTLDRAVSASPKVIRTITANKTPSLFPVSNLDQSYLNVAGIIKSREDFHDRVGHALARRFQDRPEPDHVEEQIYSGFYSASDKMLLEEFQGASWPRRAEILAQLQDIRLVQLGRRILFQNAPEFLPRDFSAGANASIESKWSSNDKDAKWTTWSSVDAQMETICENGLLDDQARNDLRDFYANLRR